MRGYLTASVSLALGLWIAAARAEEAGERPAGPASTLGFALGRPIPLDSAVPPQSKPSVVNADLQTPVVSISPPRAIIRAQSGGPPPPPPPPTGGSVAGSINDYNCAVVGKPGGFFNRCGDCVHEWWQGIPGSVTGVFQATPSRAPFQSDTKYSDKFISPVTNPFYFEDPRALTEVKPLFMWQSTGHTNPVYHGGSNFWFGLQARVAITDWFSIVMPKLGFISSNPNTVGPNPPGEFHPNTGFSEITIGPKFTIIRAENFVGALGLNFEIPAGGAAVFQNTGSLSIDPYLSFAINFWQHDKIGTFIFQTTNGYSISTNHQRTDFFYGGYHLSLDFRNLHKIYPLVELNWTHYTVNGRTRDIGFEGNDMFNFGSNGSAGHDDLVLAGGFRYKVSEHLQFGLGLGWSVLGSGRHMDAFRMTVDTIIRY